MVGVGTPARWASSSMRISGVMRQCECSIGPSVRIIVFTGKGGVGKTSVAAATALRIAHSGARTLVMSTDPAHSLADAYEAQISPELTEIAPNLFGQQIDAQQRLEQH